MKSSVFKFLLVSFAFISSTTLLFAQDDDGIYGDIYETPEVEEEIEDTNAPLDGYSTVDDYYPEEGTGQNQNSITNQPYSDQYVDEAGNGVTNNYYGDYYEEEEEDYAYSSRIRRFHRNNSWGYYDPWYTNMYYYNYDPFYWGTSIYTGYRPSYNWGWNNGWTNWGWNNGWNNTYGYPACYGGGYGYGGFGNSYNNGYNNGFNNGLAYGGYNNTLDAGSGIYYGHRGSGDGTLTSLGSGYRSKTLASSYNNAALEGKVTHANRDNILKTKDGKSINAASLRGFNDKNLSDKPAGGTASTGTRESTLKGNSTNRMVESQSRTIDGSASTQTTRASNSYQRSSTERKATVPARYNPNNVDRSRSNNSTASRPNSQSASRTNTYERGNSRNSVNSGQQNSRSNTNQSRGNVSRDMRSTQPNSGNNSGNNSQYSRPSNSRSNGYQQPLRNTTKPTRTTPSRSAQPSRSTRPSRSTKPSGSVSPNRGSSSKTYSTPSRSGGSSGGSRSGSRSSGSSSKGGRP